jgi:hypothetical protein
MDLTALVVTLIALGRIDGALLGRLGEWFDLQTEGMTFSLKDMSVSRRSAVLQTLGFVMLGFSSTLGMLVPSKSTLYYSETKTLYLYNT